MQRPQHDVQRTLGKLQFGGELCRRDWAWVTGRNRRQHRLLASSHSVIRATSHRVSNAIEILHARAAGHQHEPGSRPAAGRPKGVALTPATPDPLPCTECTSSADQADLIDPFDVSTFASLSVLKLGGHERRAAIDVSTFASLSVPQAVLVDRGSAFVSSQLLRACAVLGAKLIHASPRAATTKGKIERFFRTCRDRFLVELEERDDLDLVELNRLFGAWLEVVYHRRVHSETQQTPLERFGAAGAPPLPTPALLREAFLWSQERTVTKTATVSLHGNQYEVDAALVGRKVEVVFDPFDLTRIEIRYQQRPFGLAVPLVIGRHTHPQAERELPPPPTPTGIDYLKLLADKRDAELAGHRIDYASLTNGDGDGDGRDIDQETVKR